MSYIGQTEITVQLLTDTQAQLQLLNMVVQHKTTPQVQCQYTPTLSAEFLDQQLEVYNSRLAFTQ
jgi:hypothetical protein